jgi:hypothetical protein
MNPSHSQALHSFVFRLKLLFLLRAGVQMATVWFFVWGVVVLVVRISGAHQTEWLAFGVLGFAPLAIIAGARALSRQPAFARVRASYDQLKACGGVIMSEEVADMTVWQAQIPKAAVPKLRWHSRQALLLLVISAVFTTVTLLLPERLTRFSSHRSLEISQIVAQLQTEVKTLQQEKIVEDKKAEDLQKQLTQLKQDSSALDPNKTWEALDHIKESDSDAAKQAAQEALIKMTELTQAETLAKAMEQAADSGMTAEISTQAARDLASRLNAAKLEDGILKGQIPPELLASLNGLNKEQLEKLLQALELDKNTLGLMVSNLANLRLVDAATLAKCQNAGQCPNPDALAAYLSTCTNGCNALAVCTLLGKGGPGGGGPAAPMTWDNDTSEKDVKFQEHALPPSAHLSDAQFVGVSKAVPELSGNDVAAGHGALDNAVASGGTAHSQVILPEHRQAVQRFFERDK